MNVTIRVATGLLLYGLSTGQAVAEEVDLREAFEKAKTSKSVNIDISDDDLLVAKGGPPLVLHGRRLVISARAMRIDADTTIMQFDPSDTPPASPKVGDQGDQGAAGKRPGGRNGYDGKPGGKGKTPDRGLPGKDAKLVLLDVVSLTGAGKLIIVNDGGGGGKGGQGGKGGTGGRGEDGANGSDSLVDCRAGGGDGGTGGLGGPGGVGSRGGPGGQGGEVRYAASLEPSLGTGVLTVSVKGGIGGLGGDPGVKGDGGGRGAGGSDSTYCGSGSNGGTGKDGPGGEKGDDGESGSNGKIVRFD